MCWSVGHLDFVLQTVFYKHFELTLCYMLWPIKPEVRLLSAFREFKTVTTIQVRESCIDSIS